MFLRFVNLLKYVLEASVISLEDSVFGAHVEWPFFLECHLEGGVGEGADGLVRVVHTHNDAAAILEREQLEALRSTTLGGVDQLDAAGLVANKVGRLVLVTVCVAADDDGLGPAGYNAWDVLADDRLTENSASQNVTDCAVGRWPHFLQLEF